MANDDTPRPNLRDMSVDQIRNGQRGPAEPPGDAGPEGSATLRRVWSEPGGEAMSYRNAILGTGSDNDDHSELTAAETPDTHRHLSDASLTPAKPQGPAKEAVDRATASVGHDADDDR